MNTQPTKAQKSINSLSFKLVAAILLFLISLGIFSVIADEIVIEKEDWFDSRMFSFLKAHSSPDEIQLFNFFTFFGSSTFLFPAYILFIAFLLYKHRKADAINVGVLCVTGTMLMYGLKVAFARHRPDSPLFKALTTYSFPSGHSFSSFVFFSILSWELWQSKIATVWKWAGTLCFLGFSLLIGISRIVLRYHYASDVIAGFSLALAYVLLYYWVQSKWWKRRAKAS